MDPVDLTDLTRHLAIEIKGLGGDPYVGRRLRSLFVENGMEAEVGVHQGVWDIQMLRNQAEEEWSLIERAAEHCVDSITMNKGKAVWEEALDAGDLFQFNPVFYALGRKA